MHRAARIALATVCLVVFSHRSWAQQEIMSPKENEPGYTSAKTRDDSQPAPDGYEGRTETGERTWTGTTPATAGRRFVMDFTLANEIKVCPKADGTAEGDGQFSLTAKYTDTKGNAGTLIMRADAKYKGQVGDDAQLQGPVTADIDYSYSVTGNFPDKSGAIFTPTPIYVEQHIKMEVGVVMGMDVPKLGAMSGGDPTQSHYAEAYGAGMALTFWGGVYFGIAELRWTKGECVEVSFDPPSNTVQPALGTHVAVKTQLKSKAGEITKATYGGAVASLGSVDPGAGVSDVGTPMTFTYTAPDQKPPSGSTRKPGFQVEALSRAGATYPSAVWEAVLGTGWSGSITCRRENWGEDVHSEFGSYSAYEVMQLTMNAKDGKGVLTGYGEQKIASENRQGIATGGTKKTDSSFTQASVSGSSPVTVDVHAYEGKYTVEWTATQLITGKGHSQSCIKDSCKDSDFVLGVDVPCGGQGDLTDPNHVQGSYSDLRTNAGATGHGKMLTTATWDLARQGTTTK